MIDSHCHLDHEPLLSNIKSVIQRSKKVGIEKLQSGLGKLGYHFEAPTLDGGDGEYSMPLSYGSGTFQADYDENSYGEFKEGDGISDHIEGGVSLKIEVMKSGTGKSIMTAEIVRNAEQG